MGLSLAVFVDNQLFDAGGFNIAYHMKHPMIRSTLRRSSGSLTKTKKKHGGRQSYIAVSITRTSSQAGNIHA